MKRVLLILAAITLVFAVVGCGSNGAASVPSDSSTTFEGKDLNNQVWKLVVSAAKVAAKDNYVLSVGSLKSSGTIVSATAASIELSKGGTVTLNGNKIDRIDGLITFDDGTMLAPDFDTELVNAFDEAVGIKAGIAVQGAATLTSTDNGSVIGLGDGLGGSSLFTLLLPGYQATAEDGDKTITITYICKVESGTAKVTIKDGAWNDPPNKGSFNIYPTLKVGEEATLEIPEKIYADGTEVISFQCNDDANSGAKFYIKIIDVTMAAKE